MRKFLTQIFGLLALFLFINFGLVSAQTITEEAGKFIPDISVGNIGVIITIFITFLIILILIGIGTFMVIRMLKFNIDITIWEDVEGHDDLEPVGRDKAMLVRVGKGGTQLLYLRKRKIYRGAYGKRIGKKQYFFVIGKDGYWYNATLGSLEKGLNSVNIKPTAVNMRYQNESLMEVIKARYDKPNFWAQYGQLILNLAFFMVIAIMFWLYFAEFKKVAPALVEAANALRETGEAMKQIIGGLDSVKATGGVIPA